MTKVQLSSLATRQLHKVPRHIALKLKVWVDSVTNEGLRETRRSPGFHDEPLKGKRKGQRSIRLSRAYRAIYSVSKDGEIELVMIVEVNKHDY